MRSESLKRGPFANPDDMAPADVSLMHDAGIGVAEFVNACLHMRAKHLFSPV